MTPQGELWIAAANLCQRAELLGAPTSKVPSEAWQPFVPELIPQWWISLLEEFPLAGLVLEYRDRIHNYAQLFGFMAASEFQAMFRDSGFHVRLTGYGWFPVGVGSDGDLWLIRTADGPSSEVFLLEHSAWNGDEPTKHNGLRFAASRLSYLILSMGISEASYYARETGPTRIIWYPDRTSNLPAA